jgi:glycosyltransferase involved in cell wall biosynthesis
LTAYQRVCVRLKGRAVRVGFCDNQWRGTLRQQLGRLIAPIHLRRFYDVLFVTGERQAMWARRMGFAEERIWKGVYTCDIGAFATAAALRQRGAPAFLCAARLVPEKGIQTLLRSYDIYRKNCTGSPWSLILAGDGPLRDAVTNVSGIDLRGFVQPQRLPAIFAEASVFVMPSIYEPWCVALQEAASASLPLIATAACGSAVHLLQDGYNGYLVSPDSAEGLATAMLRMSARSEAQLAAMGDRSAELSKA